VASNPGPLSKTDETIRKNIPTFLKISVLVMALSFLVYHVYWEIMQIPWFYNVTIILYSPPLNLEYNLFLLAFQEYSAIVGYLLILIGAVYAIDCAILFTKNDCKQVEKLSKTFIFSSLFLHSANTIRHQSFRRRRYNVLRSLQYLCRVFMPVPSSSYRIALTCIGT
jgi:hypothetical protein